MNQRFLKYAQCKEIFGGISRKTLNEVAKKCNGKVCYGRYQVYDVDAITSQMRRDARQNLANELGQICENVK